MDIKVEVIFTDGYEKRYTEAVAKAFVNKKRKEMVVQKPDRGTSDHGTLDRSSSRAPAAF